MSPFTGTIEREFERMDTQHKRIEGLEYAAVPVPPVERSSAPPVPSPERRAAVDRARQHWIGRPVDLSRRNNLLYFRDLKVGTLDLTATAPDVMRELLQSGGSNGGGFPQNPVARSLSDLVTAKQLGMIRAMAREIGVDPDEECNGAMQCKTDELSKKAASAFIQHLQDMQKSQDAGQNQPMRRAG